MIEYLQTGRPPGSASFALPGSSVADPAREKTERLADHGQAKQE
jgi:hypothetical protein